MENYIVNLNNFTRNEKTMGRSKHPVALFPILPTEFLEYILQHHQPPTTIIICSTREAFLQELKASIAFSAPTAESAENSSSQVHHLLKPTLHLIATSRSVNLTFTPTLPHLRAYLATYNPETALLSSTSGSETRSRAQKPILSIWGFATIHRSTADHSAQGLSRTLAAAVEAARLAGQQLVFAESVGTLDEEGVEVGYRSLEPWREQVPLLSGSVRFGGEGSGLGGRLVEVGAVVGRWCRFVRLERLGEGS